jgi:AraC-like DNA-binding protein
MPEKQVAYVEYPASAELSQYVECFWSRTSQPDDLSDVAPDAHLVLPDGCIDIVFNFSDGAHRVWNVAEEPPPRSSVVGTMTRPLQVQTGGRVRFIGVRFKPGKSHHFVGVPAGEITNLTPALDDIWPADTRGIEDTLSDLTRPDQQVAVLERELRRQARRLDSAESCIERLVAFIQTRRGDISVESLSALAGLTRQQIARQFNRYVGLSPKLFCRVVRFQNILAMARRQQAPDWISIALESGYYDQAHMIQDFKEFTGVNPTLFYSHH